MAYRLKTDNKLVRTVWWILFIAFVSLFIVVIFRPVLKDYLVNFIYQTIFSQNTVLDDVFLRQYQMFFLSVPILAIFGFCILVFLVSLIFKKYKKADWIFAAVCLVGVICAVIIPNISTFNRAQNATYEGQTPVVFTKDKYSLPA